MLGATGWLGMVRGVVVAPSVPTCGSRVLDFFVVAESFASAVAGVTVVENAAFKPHSPVRLLLRPRPRAIHVRRLISPTALGPTFPAGPPSRPRTDSDYDLPRPTDQWQRWGDEYVRWITDAQEELADLAGLVGTERRKHCGRAAGPNMVWEPAMGATSQPRLLVNKTTSTWRAAAAALYDATVYHRKVHILAALADNGVGGTHAVAVAGARRLCALRFRAIADDSKLGLDYAQCRLPSGYAETPILRDWLIELVLTRLNKPRYTHDRLLEARAQARRLEAACARSACAQWHRWIHSGPAAGLGRQRA